MRKKYVGLLAFLFALVIAGCSTVESIPNRNRKSPAKFKVATYNIRLPSKADLGTGNSWDIRKQAVADLIVIHDFDIFGGQEPFQNQIDDLDEVLKGYSHVTAPYATKCLLAIYYKKELFETLDSCIFWRS